MTATILAIDTTTDVCSAALAKGNQIYARKILAPREHAQRILGLVEALLIETDLSIKQLDAIAYGCGPGSFTGLRIAAGVVQGLAYAAGVPVIPISSLRSIALLTQQQFQTDLVMAALDARQHEVYWGMYKADAEQLMALQGQELVLPPSEVPLPDNVTEWVGAGPGWQAYQGILNERLEYEVSTFEDIVPEAEAVVQLALRDYAAGKMLPVEKALPTYIRDDVV
jgi:tRNA threonylcarbamoyladenosine biosynthesis protein TsaB